MQRIGNTNCMQNFAIFVDITLSLVELQKDWVSSTGFRLEKVFAMMMPWDWLKLRAAII